MLQHVQIAILFKDLAYFLVWSCICNFNKLVNFDRKFHSDKCMKAWSFSQRNKEEKVQYIYWYLCMCFGYHALSEVVV